MKRVLLALALAVAGPAFAEEAKPPVDAGKPPVHQIVKQDAKIVFASTTVRGFQVAEDRSILLDAGPRWYRVTVWNTCRFGLPFVQHIGYRTAATGTLDRFGDLVIEGRVCPIETIDEIAKPARKPAKPAAATPAPFGV